MHISANLVVCYKILPRVPRVIPYPINGLGMRNHSMSGVAGKQTSVKIYLSSLYVLYKGLLLFSVYATIVSPDTIRDAFREYIYTVD